MNEALHLITKELTEEISEQLSKSGMMFRLFSRVKSLASIKHKFKVKYADKKATLKIQDIIGVRIVVYFQDDVDALSLYFSQGNVVKTSIDEFDTSTFRPQRLNLTHQLPEQMIAAFRSALPLEYADIIDNTYEIQVRTVFSEGWHEVEHDLRYKCKEDWKGCETHSRVLNGVIATLETAEWTIKELFTNMARHNLLHGNYSAMLRNMMHIRLHGEGLSEQLTDFLRKNKTVAETVLNTDRLIVMYTLLGHQASLELTYDTLLFLINRIEVMHPGLMELETKETARLLDSFLNS